MSVSQHIKLWWAIKMALGESSGLTPEQIASRLNAPIVWVQRCLEEMREAKEVARTKGNIYLTAVLGRKSKRA